MKKFAAPKGIPPIRVAPRRTRTKKHDTPFSADKELVFRYESREHKKQPHIVKFSGGRSSGMLLLLLLKNDFLDPKRGDVIIFNNTSAEHPATYEFVRELTLLAEQRYKIPFLWTEFQTYEDVSQGRWTRVPSYRLVRPQPFSDNCPDGYHWRGEVFEEMLSWKAFVPNIHQRVCTESMKLLITKEFLRDWLAGVSETRRLGHYGDGSRITDNDVLAMHRINGGNTPDDILLKKKAFVRSRPTARRAQCFADYSDATGQIDNPQLYDLVRGGRVSVSGDNPAEYVSFVGLRNDEPVRIARMRARNRGLDDDAGVHERATPEGEYVYAPLDDFNIRKEDIKKFWRRRKPRLLLPDDANLSNCVFCFLKSSARIRDLVARQHEIDNSLPEHLRSVPNTPSDISWWIRMEDRYGRDLIAEKRAIRADETRPVIGFFGSGGSSYNLIQQSASEIKRQARANTLTSEQSLDCECTD